MARQAEDSEIYDLAIKEKMFVVTMNYKHFKKLVRKKMPGVFSLESELTNEQIDNVLSDFIAGKNPLDYYGKAIKIK